MKFLTWMMVLGLMVGNAKAGPKVERFLVKNGKPIGLQLKASKWKQMPGWIEGHGGGNDVLADSKILEGDFLLSAELRINNQRGSAASFFLEGNHFGFEGGAETVFVNGPIFGGLKLMMPAPEVVHRGQWIHFEVERKEGLILFRVNEKQITSVKSSLGFENFGFRPWRSTMQVRECIVKGEIKKN